MKIRAAVLHEMGKPRPYAASQPLAIEELELEGPGPGEVLVRVEAAGLCHSDLSVINGDRPRPLPMALGHEAAGVVEATGPNVTDLARGDHVVMVFVPSCGRQLRAGARRAALCVAVSKRASPGRPAALGARQLDRPQRRVRPPGCRKKYSPGAGVLNKNLSTFGTFFFANR